VGLGGRGVLQFDAPNTSYIKSQASVEEERFGKKERTKELSKARRQHAKKRGFERQHQFSTLGNRARLTVSGPGKGAGLTKIPAERGGGKDTATGGRSLENLAERVGGEERNRTRKKFDFETSYTL